MTVPGAVTAAWYFQHSIIDVALSLFAWTSPSAPASAAAAAAVASPRERTDWGSFPRGAGGDGR